jgi:uroporphyrinogen-III synthase
LQGKRVVVTRAIEQTADLLALLTARGAAPISLPLVSFAPPEDYAPLDAALARWNSYDWIIFTSANAVDAVTARPTAGTLAAHAPGSAGNRPQIAAVGPATKFRASAAGFAVDYVAKSHLGVALANELRDRLAGKSVFLPRSDRANPDLPAALRDLGANLTEVVAYRTLPPEETNRSRLMQTLERDADAIFFFSPSAVHNLADLAGHDCLPSIQLKLAVVAVGPVTGRALQELGVTRFVIAADTTTAAVVDALEQHFANPADPTADSSKSLHLQNKSGATRR